MTERKGQTALYGAVKNGWADVVEHLLAKGADPRVSDALGRTPVDAALGRIAGRNNVVSEEDRRAAARRRCRRSYRRALALKFQTDAIVLNWPALIEQ